MIAGGGLAGLSLGIALRNRGIPVTVIEAGTYPRHRVCGEFLSGCGEDILRELGVFPACMAAGVRWAKTVRFASGFEVGPVRPLPRPAACLSRFQLDALLAAEFRRVGGALRTAERAPDTTGIEGWVRATGRRIAPTEGPWRWFGIKAHARGVSLDADLELHFAKNSYVGLCRLDDERVNICGLFRRHSANRDASSRSPLDWLRGPEGSPWQTRVTGAVFDPDSVCATGGLDLRMLPRTPPDSVVLGDTLAIIPPLTGNGMSLALESAQRATGPLAAFAGGSETWSRTCEIIRCDQHRAFRQRLAWAGVLQRLLFAPIVPTLLYRLLYRSDAVWKGLFALTRA